MTCLSLQEYTKVLQQYFVLQEALNTHLDTMVIVQPPRMQDWDFRPSFSSFLMQLRNWPVNVVAVPPSEWVIPIQGIIDFNGTKWKFGFHGQGVTFWSEETTQDVSTEFSAQGHCAITKWTTRMYLETFPVDLSLKDYFLSVHEQFFGLLVEQEYLRPVPPRLSGDDQTYVSTAMEAQLAQQR